MLANFREKIQIVECPRDAMQGWSTFIPTNQKVDYLNALLKVGFHTLDCGSFVSPKRIPQMADTKEVLARLSLSNTQTRLLVIVANRRGAEEAVQCDNITYLGYPFSISPTFQFKNANSTMEESLHRLEEIQQLCVENNKELVVYLSMAFGNPYGDEYDDETLLHWADEMVKRNLKIVSLADTIGLATPEQINFALDTLIPAYPQATFGVHLHSEAHHWQDKLQAAVEAGCRRFDGALKGIGGCPLADNHLVGNLDTEWMITYFQSRKMMNRLNEGALKEAASLAAEIFS